VETVNYRRKKKNKPVATKPKTPSPRSGAAERNLLSQQHGEEREGLGSKFRRGTGGRGGGGSLLRVAAVFGVVVMFPKTLRRDREEMWRPLPSRAVIQKWTGWEESRKTGKKQTLVKSPQKNAIRCAAREGCGVGKQWHKRKCRGVTFPLGTRGIRGNLQKATGGGGGSEDGSASGGLPFLTNQEPPSKMSE